MNSTHQLGSPKAVAFSKHHQLISKGLLIAGGGVPLHFVRGHRDCRAGAQDGQFPDEGQSLGKTPRVREVREGTGSHVLSPFHQHHCSLHRVYHWRSLSRLPNRMNIIITLQQTFTPDLRYSISLEAKQSWRMVCTRCGGLTETPSGASRM